MSLHAEVDGKMLPLTECDWVMFRRCGCPRGVSMAELPNSDYLVPTESAAWKEFFDTKREIAKAQREGLTIELVSHQRWCDEIGPKMQYGGCNCDELAAAERPDGAA